MREHSEENLEKLFFLMRLKKHSFPTELRNNYVP